MKTVLPVPVLNQNRPATQEELDHAAMVLRSFGNDVLARQVENAGQHDQDDDCLVRVVTSFDDAQEVQVLLLPPGTYRIPPEILENDCYIIGLSAEPTHYPVLMLQGDPVDIINTETLMSTMLRSCQASARLAGVTIDAAQPTVVEIYFNERKQFSDVFFQVQYRPNTDVLNIGTCTFCNGREWALAAYGSIYRGRNGLEKGLDAFHEGLMGAIDGTFKPLVRLGEKLDKVLGLK